MNRFGLGSVLRLRRACLGLVFVFLILMGGPLAALVHVVLAQPTTVLTPKWTRSSLGTNWEGGLVIGDVTGDGQEDVVYTGGSSDTIYVLDGDDGSTIATYTNSRIGTYSQSALYDVDGDGVLDILVPLYYEPGMAAVKYDGDSGLYEMWEIYSQADQAPGGSVGSGSVMAKAVAGDIDGDGDLDIFLASQDISPIGGYDGTIVRLDKDGNILYTTFTWRACSGGLSLGDTDNDGVFELYQGDRDMDYSDGGYGKGAKSYWADDLSERWIRLDDLTSSQAPVLADVNGDGIKDVMAGMYREMYVWDSSNGEVIYYWSDNAMSVHYGFTVYDIDGDGHLELLCNDGDHDDQPFTDVFDLVTGEMDAQLSMGPGVYDPEEEEFVGGDWKWGPLVADIDGVPGMEIISAPNGTGLDGGAPWNGAIMIWGSNYESLQNVTYAPGSIPGTYSTTRLGSQLGFPVVQDIDGDGYLELVTHSSYPGNVYAFDTPAPAPGHNEDELPGSKRLRSEVTYYGEARLGVAEHTIMPWEDDYWTAPLVAPVSPVDNALAVPVLTTQLSFQLREHQSESLNYSVTTSPNIGSADGLISSGTYDWNVINVSVSGLNYDTTYRWTVTADDGSEVTSRTYTFRTELAPAIGNSPPSQGDPLLVSLDGLNTTTSTFVGYNQSTTDSNGDNVTNIYRWLVEGEPVAQLLLPFDTRDETSTTDYSGFGNDGMVKGAVWVPDGVMGGAYSFDGKDDVIMISDGGAGYFNDVDNSGGVANHEELGGYGNWDGVTVEAWIYLTEYNNGSRIVAKIPSYALGFESHRTSRLYAAVWPYTGEIADDDNQGSVDRMRGVYADVDIDLNTWYHIAFTYENGVGLKLYLDGQLVGQSSTPEGPLSPSRGEPVYIGRLVQPFAGMIDDVRIYSYAQPEEQILNRYMESKDGNSSSSVFLPVGIGFPGDELECQIIPTDSYEEGTMMSASVILQNTPPSAGNLEIYPIRGRDLRLTGEDLAAAYDYTDPDGDVEGSSMIEWFMNGAPQAAFENLTEVPAASTAVGQEWNFTVTPRDSNGGFGDPVTSYTVTIRGNVAPSTGTPDLVSSGGTDEEDEDLIASAVGSSDTDGDSVTNIYRWTLEGSPLMNLLMPFDTEVPLYLDANGTTLDYSGWGNDGTVVGSRWVEDGVVGGAFSFDGDDFIRVNEVGGSLGGSGWSQITVEYWVKATGTTGTESVIAKHDLDFSPGGWQGGSYGIGYRADFRVYDNRDRFYWYVYNATAVASVEFSDYESFGEWHHVVCTYEDGVGLKLYVDGTQQASTMFAGSINATLDGILDIGGYGTGGTDFSGLLDEVRIYPFALSSAQIFQRFVETKDGLSDSSTIAYQETAPNDDWEVEVIPSDSWEDGAMSSVASIHVTSATGNGQPRIDWYSPADTTPDVNEGESLDFMQVSSDPGGDPLNFTWTLDAVEVATSQNWTYSPDLASQGIHTVGVNVTDGALSDYQEWTVNVIEVEVRNLTVLAAANGVTDPAPGTYPILLNTNTEVLAIPDVAYMLDHWLLNSSDIGSANPVMVNMTDNFELAPVFVEGQYNLTVNIVGNGSVTLDPDQATYSYGVNVSLTAVPDADWLFVGWSGDASGSELTTTINMTSDMTVTATFAEEEYFTLTVIVVGSGSVTADPDLESYLVGTEVSLTAVADEGWEFAGWSGNASGTDNPVTIGMTGNLTVTATFLELFSLEIAVDGEGTTVPAPGTYEYSDGSEVEVDAVPNPGYALSHWLLNGSYAGDTDPYTVIVDADYVLTAVFQLDLMFADGFESGDTSQWSGSLVTGGDTVTVVGNLHHHGSYGALFTTDGVDSIERAYVFVNVGGSEIYVRGYFNIDSGLPMVATDNRFNLFSFMSGTTTLASLSVRRAGSADVWSITSIAGLYFASSGPVLDQWYAVEFYMRVDSVDGALSMWVDGTLVINQTGLNTGTSSINSVRAGLVYVTGVPAGVNLYGDCFAVSDTYIGLEADLPEYTLAVNIVGSGSVTKNPDQATYTEGASVELTALADAGWRFAGWSGDLTSTNSSESILMDGNKTVTATFTLNAPPTIDSYYPLSDPAITEEESQLFNVTYSDTDGDELTIQWLLNGSLVESGDNYTFTADYESAGTYNVTVVVSDGLSQVTHEWTLTVENVNRAPTIDSYAPVDPEPTVDEGASLNFNNTSSDPDADPLSYSWLLEGVEQVTTQNWTYMPGYEAAGTYNITLVVSDGELTDSLQWNVTVNDVNRPPVIDDYYPSTDPAIDEGESQLFNVTYHDPDGNPLTVQWYLNGTPTSTLDNYTFLVDYDSAGVYNVTVGVSDGLAEASHEWTLTVTNVNRAPTIDSYTPVDLEPQVDEGASLDFNHTSSDPDGDSLFYSWLLDDVEQATTQNWTYTPNYEDSGFHNVTLVVSDGELTDVQQWNVTVAETYTLQINVFGSGSVTKDPDQAYYTYGTEVNLTAIADPGWLFSEWSHDLSGSVNPETIVMDGNKTVNATFVPASDLVVSEILLPYPEPRLYTNRTYQIGVNVTNLGDYEAVNFNVSLELFYLDGATVVYYSEQTISSLGSGASMVLNFTVSPTLCGSHDLNAVVDVHDVVSELDEANNLATVSLDVYLAGDVDGDGDVDIFDIIHMAMAYGSTVGDSRYDPLCDLDVDGDVDIFDVTGAAGNYGRTYPVTSAARDD